jgi:hypothetical protein
MLNEYQFLLTKTSLTFKLPECPQQHGEHHLVFKCASWRTQQFWSLIGEHMHNQKIGQKKREITTGHPRPRRQQSIHRKK